AGRISQQIEADSLSIINVLNDTAFILSKGFDHYNRISVFIPNTYEIWWNTTAQQLYDKMYSEYQKFWNEDRKNKAKLLNMNPLEVISLAAIVEQETSKKDERPKVAGVYLNRIKTGMPLQADPTLIFAAGDFSIRRVLNHHKEIESPFNTYKYTGVPPGPICVPSISSIDAVLDFENHNYIFFCAKDDFSGYHNFAVSYNEHLINARKYQAAMNRKKIMK
ncbi:MAG: endolytic transglycosylase MltG, partial [Bacteroidales bacterium]|nr:endolytic transglycosylase MltG [Bacteroidales bacterium]